MWMRKVRLKRNGRDKDSVIGTSSMQQQNYKKIKAYTIVGIKPKVEADFSSFLFAFLYP